MNDLEYMRLALELAERSRMDGRILWWGAVIVKDGRVIGQGWHETYGGFHAERNALRSCTEPPQEGRCM